MSRRDFWSTYQPGLRVATSPVGTPEFFSEVTTRRYELEPHIPSVVDFQSWSGSRVLEAGCGIGTDGARFAAAGAEYTGLDFSRSAPILAQRRFELEHLRGQFVAGSVTSLPFADGTFDLVFSHGVIHHIPETEAAIEEFHRVLKPGGMAVVMIYHRRSLNYYVSILIVRRLLAAILMIPSASALVSKLTGEPAAVVAGHRALLQKHGLRYILDRDMFLSRNTDGPENPLSKVYSRQDATALFSKRFRVVSTEVRYLNLRLYPGGVRFSKTRVARWLERRFGWHLYIKAVKQP